MTEREAQVSRRKRAKDALQQPYPELQQQLEKRGAQLAAASRQLQKEIAEFKAAGETSHRLAALIRDSNDAVVLLDSKGNILAWNRGAEDMYGWSEAEAQGGSGGSLKAGAGRSPSPQVTLLAAYSCPAAPYEPWSNSAAVTTLSPLARWLPAPPPFIPQHGWNICNRFFA